MKVNQTVCILYGNRLIKYRRHMITIIDGPLLLSCLHEFIGRVVDNTRVMGDDHYQIGKDSQCAHAYKYVL